MSLKISIYSTYPLIIIFLLIPTIIKQWRKLHLIILFIVFLNWSFFFSYAR